MGALEVPVVGVGAEALEAYLSSDRSPPDSMGLSDLDGFLTAVAIGPELVMPSEWLPIVWGGEEPVFADDGEAQAVIGGIMSRYNAILRDVADGNFEPILWITADDIVIATDWAEGFMQGIGLRAKAWEPLLHSKRHALLLFPIFALCGDEHGESLLGLDPEDEDRIMADDRGKARRRTLDPCPNPEGTSPAPAARARNSRNAAAGMPDRLLLRPAPGGNRGHRCSDPDFPS